MTAAEKPIPGPKGRPLVGMLPEMIRDMLGLFTDLNRQYGGIVQFKLLNKPYLLVTSPEYVKHILQKEHHNYIRGRSVETGRVLLGDGLPLIDGDVWLRERRLLQPAFHRQKLSALTDTIVGAIRERLETWQGGQTFDMEEEMTDLTLSIIIKTMFSGGVGREQVKALGDAFRTASAFMLWRSQQMWAPPLWVPVPRNAAYNKALKTLNGIVYPLIAEGRKGPQENLLGLLVNARDEETGEGMSDAQLRDEIVTIFFAGHETSTMALTWAFYLISQHPHVEARLIEEIGRVLDGRDPAFADLPQLTYTQQVISEVLRLYPSAYLFAREAVTDQPLDGYRIPAGTMIFITPYVTHHDPAYWNDPEAFDPERFNAENSASRSKDIYYPFGAGPHVCIGNNLAMMEMQLTLAMAYQRFKPRLVAGHPIGLKPEATLRPKHGMKMTLQ
jgi:cytochrome P450